GAAHPPPKEHRGWTAPGNGQRRQAGGRAQGRSRGSVRAEAAAGHAAVADAARVRGVPGSSRGRYDGIPPQRWQAGRVRDVPAASFIVRFCLCRIFSQAGPLTDIPPLAILIVSLAGGPVSIPIARTETIHGPEEVRTGTQEPLPLLHERRLP